MIRSILPLLVGATLFTAGLAGCNDKAKATSESASAKPKSSAAPASSGAPAANTAAPKDPPKDPPKKDDSGW